MADNENISLNKEEVGEADKPKLVSDKPQKKERSFGNKTFDKVIYPFFAFFLVAVFSIVSVVKTKFGSGKPKEFYDNLVRKTADLLEKTPIVKNKSKEILVQTVSLDSIVKENNITTIDFLKMDCEGAEYKILFGCPKKILDIIQ